MDRIMEEAKGKIIRRMMRTVTSVHAKFGVSATKSREANVKNVKYRTHTILIKFTMGIIVTITYVLAYY